MIRASVLENIEGDKIKALISGVNPRIVENGVGDTKPFAENNLIILKIGNDPDDLVAISIDDGVAKAAESGELKIYSYDIDSNILSSIYLNKESEIVLNDGEDYAVQFTALQTAFNQLKSDFDALVNLHNTHIHITTATVGLAPPVGTIGVLKPTTSTGSPTTADIAPAKIEKIRVP